MKILAVSDIEVGILQSSAIRERFKESRLLISCGDLPFDYLENIVNALDIPLYFVFGNHASRLEKGENERKLIPWGAIDLDQRTYMDEIGLLMAGMEGSLQYNFGPHQYSQTEMWLKIFGLIPALTINRLRYGRFLDVFVTHAPPWQIHDQTDLPHRGIKAFRWFLKVFKPTYHLHGHIHIYTHKTIRESIFEETRVLNVYGYREVDIPVPPQRSRNKE
jgi:uncharacterized protein